MTNPLWSPPQRIKAMRLAHFMQSVNTKHRLALNDYDGLWQWSLNEPEKFWQAVWDFCGVIGNPGEIVLRKQTELWNHAF